MLDANWTPDADNTSDYAFTHGHQGGQFDPDTGLIHFRNRDYSPTLGRWVQPDPLRYVDGMNSYEALAANPLNYVDPEGERSNRANRIRRNIKKSRERERGERRRLTDVRRCQRTIDMDDYKGAVANALGSHGYIALDDELGGWGLQNTNAKKDELAAPDSPGSEAIDCQPCDATNAPLKHGKGMGKPANQATDDEIKDCIKNTPLKADYGWTYNCNSWADDALKDCGLDCDFKSQRMPR